MTSNRLFFNAMRDDLRHKSWMIALSFLANMLALPVMCLVNWDALTRYKGQVEALGYSPEALVQEILLWYGRKAMGMSGTVAMAAAVTAGLAAFRFLFHRSSVDLYHGLPIRRNTLFKVCYLNGFLIWFVPFLACLGMSAAVTGSFLRENLGQVPAAWGMAKMVFSCIMVCLVDFLLVYNLVLTAVMLCGNALNALVSILVLGFGGVGIWGVGYMFLGMYMDTVGSKVWGGWEATYASPLVSAVVLLYRAIDELRAMLQQGEIWKMLLINLVVAISLGLCAWILYMRRPSEHAEQGIRNRAVSAWIRMICGVGAGMCGWMLFCLLSENMSVLWGCFGAALAAVLTYGGLDIVFQMDFKAFFSHKLQMGAALLLSFLLCFCFYQDWLGYDTYLPDKEEIAEIGIYHYFFGNREFSYEDILEKVRLQDMELIYPYLERATAWQAGEGRYGQEDVLPDTAVYEGVVYDAPADTGQVQSAGTYGGETQKINTRVTLKSGRSYYRMYTIPEKDKEVLLALLTSQEYIEQAYLLDEKTLENALDRITLFRGDSQLVVENADTGKVLSIVRAYNQDLRESPEKAVLGQGRLLVRVLLDTKDGAVLDVYDDMSRTVEALEQAGYEDWVRVEEASDIASIELGLFYNGKGYFADQGTSGEDRVTAARLTYGVYGEETEEELRARFQEAAKAFQETWPAEPGAEIFYEGEVENWSLLITEPEEVEEFLEWMEYEHPGRSSLFRKSCVKVTVTARDGRVFSGYLRQGQMPEKYIYRFAQP